MRILVAPSLLSADFARLGEEVRAIEEAGADWIHVDVMDGHFVPNITIGPPVVAALRRVARRPLDVHLMIAEPERYLGDFARAGADGLTVHVEACRDLAAALGAIRALGKRAGVALNPATPLAEAGAALAEADLVLLMTVNPGFGSQAFMPSVLPKIAELRAAHPSLDIQVDGGIKLDTTEAVVAAGANVLVSGSGIFSRAAGDYAAVIGELRLRAEKAAQGRGERI